MSLRRFSRIVGHDSVEVATARARIARVFGEQTEAIIERAQRDRGSPVGPTERERLRSICSKHGADAADAIASDAVLRLDRATDEVLGNVFRDMVEPGFRRSLAKEFLS